MFVVRDTHTHIHTHLQMKEAPPTLLTYCLSSRKLCIDLHYVYGGNSLPVTVYVCSLSFTHLEICGQIVITHAIHTHGRWALF